jgi:uncharacterized membrane protein (DUF2068 family)
MVTNDPLKKNKKNRLPFIQKALVFVVLLFGCMSAVRLEQALQNRVFYTRMTEKPIAVYLAVSGAVWCIVGVASGIGLWRNESWSFWLCGFGTGIFTVWFWLERLLMHRNTASLANWLFDAIFNLVIVLFIYSTLFALFPAGQLVEDK